MKKIFKKKISFFGKEISVFAVVVVAMIAIASAALIPYFGLITGHVTVGQGLLVDGKSWDAIDIIYDATFTSLEEKNVSSGNYELKNTADVVGVVKLVTTCKDSSEVDCDEHVIITPIFKLSITGDTTIAGQGGSTDQDRVTANGGAIDLSSITNLNFAYELTTTTNGLSPYFVLGLDTDNDGVANYNAVSFQENGATANVWHTHNGVNNQIWHVVTPTGVTDLATGTFEEVKTKYTSAKIVQVKVMIGFWGDAHPTTALVKDITMNTVDVVESNGLIVRQYDSTDTTDRTWGDNIVDFSIDTYFPKMMKPDTYTITTTVNSA